MRPPDGYPIAPCPQAGYVSPITVQPPSQPGRSSGDASRSSAPPPGGWPSVVGPRRAGSAKRLGAVPTGKRAYAILEDTTELLYAVWLSGMDAAGAPRAQATPRTGRPKPL